MRHMAAALLIVGGLAGCVGAGGQGPSSGGAPRVSVVDDESAVIDERYQRGAFIWRRGGQIVFYTRVMEKDGRLRVCGAYGGEGLGTALQDLTGEAVDAMSMHFGPIRLAMGLRPFAGYDSRRPAVGQSAHCLLTDLVWRPEFEGLPVDIRLARSSF